MFLLIVHFQSLTLMPFNMPSVARKSPIPHACQAKYNTCKMAIIITIMSAAVVAVRVPGGFGDPVGGGGQDPRKPGGQAPGRSHEKEKARLTPAQKAKRKAAKLRRRHEAKSKAEAVPESDMTVGS